MPPVNSDPLSRLVVDENAVDRELLAATLEGSARLDIMSGSFAFRQGARERLSNREQVLVSLLAQKALHLLKREFPEGLRPQDVGRVTGLKGGTVRPLLMGLVEQRLVQQTPDKAYSVPGYAIEDAARLLRSTGA